METASVGAESTGSSGSGADESSGADQASRGESAEGYYGSGDDSSDSKRSGDNETQAKAKGASDADSKSAAKVARELGDQDLDALVTVKVNGKVQKLPLREAIKKAQLSDAADERLALAKNMQRQLETVFDQAKDNLKLRAQILKRMGIENEVLNAEQVLERELQRMQESPEQRELRELKEWKAEQDKIRAEQEKRVEQERYTKQEREVMGSIDQELGEAFKASGLPRSKYFVQRIAAEMLASEKRGEPLRAHDAVAKVKSRAYREVSELVGNLDVNQIREILGDANLKKLREFEVSRVNQAAPTMNSGNANQATTPGPGKNRNQPLNEKQWRAFWNS